MNQLLTAVLAKKFADDNNLAQRETTRVIVTSAILGQNNPMLGVLMAKRIAEREAEPPVVVIGPGGEDPRGGGDDGPVVGPAVVVGEGKGVGFPGLSGGTTVAAELAEQEETIVVDGAADSGGSKATKTTKKTKAAATSAAN